LVTKEIEKHSIEGYGNKKKLDNLNDCEAHESMDASQAENQTKDIVFSELPPNLITVIAEYLPLFDYLDLCFTSKELHAAIPPIQCRSTTSSKVRNHPSSPPLWGRRMMVIHSHGTSLTQGSLIQNIQ